FDFRRSDGPSQTRHLFEQLFQFDPGQALDYRRELGDDLGDITSEFAGPATDTVAGVDDDHLLGLGERFTDLAGDLGQHAHDHLDDGGFVVLLEGLSLDAHGFAGGFSLGFKYGGLGQTFGFLRFRFGHTGGFGHVRIGETGGFGGGGRPRSFGFELELFGVG